MRCVYPCLRFLPFVTASFLLLSCDLGSTPSQTPPPVAFGSSAPLPLPSPTCLNMSQGIAPTTICGVIGSPSPSSPPGAPSGTCKRGIAYGIDSNNAIGLLSKGVHWWYNWAQQPDGSATGSSGNGGMEYVPMAWSGKDLGKAIAPSSALLGFNEPDLQGQANMSPQEAAGDWPQVVSMAQTQNIGTLVSPADAMDTSWLDQFFSACSGCKVDAIAVHLYTDSLSALQGKVHAFEKYNKPIWLTEFACYHGNGCSLDEQKTFMNAAIPFLESESQVARYAWFSYPNVPNSVLLDGGQLTELGQLYVSLPSSCGKP